MINILRKYYHRNFLYIFIVIILIVLSFWVGTAYATTPHKVRMRPESFSNRPEYKPSVLITTTTIPKIAIKNIPIKVVEIPHQGISNVVTINDDHQLLMFQAGIPEAEWANVEWLVAKESGWNPQAQNRSSGACGLPQSLPCSKLPQGINTAPVDQLIWMNNYVVSRYSSWSAAVAHSRSKGWY